MFVNGNVSANITGNLSKLGYKFSNGFAKIGVLGNSITVGVGCNPNSSGFAWLIANELKARYPGIIVDNKGVSGNTTLMEYARLATDIIPNRYDLIIVEAGTNDWNQQYNTVTFEADYRKLICTLLSETTAQIISVGTGYFGTWTPANTIREDIYCGIMAKVCKEYAIPYVDVRSAMLTAIANGVTWDSLVYAPDPVHPNNAGAVIYKIATMNKINLAINCEHKLPNIRYQRFAYSAPTCIGAWTAEGSYPQLIEGYAKKSTTIGDIMTLAFEGDKAVFRLVSDADCGMAKIEIDDAVKYASYDLYGIPYSLKKIAFEDLGKGTHILKITVLAKNVASTGNRVSFNYLDAIKTLS